MVVGDGKSSARYGIVVWNSSIWYGIVVCTAALGVELWYGIAALDVWYGIALSCLVLGVQEQGGCVKQRHDHVFQLFIHRQHQRCLHHLSQV